MSKLSRGLLRIAERVVRRHRGPLASLGDPIADIARKIPADAVKGIVDAGAAAGVMTAALARQYPGVPVLAVDPNPDRRDDLQRVEQTHAGVRYCPVALGAQAGRAAFHRTAHPDASSMHAPAPQREGGVRIDVVGVEEVEVTTLDGLCAERGVVPSVVKMDLQGHERDAILGAAGCLRDSTRAVLMEALFEPLYDGCAVFGELDQMLRERGFWLFQLYEAVSDADGRLMWADALYLKKLSG